METLTRKPEWQAETAHGLGAVHRSAREIDPSAWRDAFAAECMDSRYYEVVEETIPCGFEYRYALLWRKEGGAPAIQPFFVVDQDVAAGLPGAIQAVVRKVRERFPRLFKTRILMIGCAAGEGALGHAEPWAMEALHELMELYARRMKARLVVFKDLPTRYRAHASWFRTRGYKRIPSMPGAELDLGFATFEEFMQTRLSRAYRKNLRRKFRDGRRLGEVCMETVTDITPYIDAVYPLYQQTFQRSVHRFEELTPGYFCELGRRMPDKVRFFLWRHAGRLVAFSACMVHDGTLYDLNVGLDYSLALDMHLYFQTWRDIISWAIAAGVKTYYTGPLNYDPKRHLRLKLAPLDLYVRHLSPLLNPFFGAAMNLLQPVRYDDAIPQFPNADEL